MEWWQIALTAGFWLWVWWDVARGRAVAKYEDMKARRRCSCPDAIFIQSIHEWRVRWNPKCEVHTKPR